MPLLFAAVTSRRPWLPPLYAIVDPLATGRDPVALAAELLAGGARLLQLRLTDRPAGEILAIARRLRALTIACGARLLVNDRPDVARAAAADGVHLGQEDVPVAVARRLLGSDALIGLSTHDLDEARAALTTDVDYLGVGPVFTTTSKADALPARGTPLVAAVRALTDRPLVAIGGITPERAPTVLAAGADSVAMIAALVAAADVCAATRTTLALLSSNG